jgi:hypothetical protein
VEIGKENRLCSGNIVKYFGISDSKYVCGGAIGGRMEVVI